MKNIILMALILTPFLGSCQKETESTYVRMYGQRVSDLLLTDNVMVDTITINISIESTVKGNNKFKKVIICKKSFEDVSFHMGQIQIVNYNINEVFNHMQRSCHKLIDSMDISHDIERYKLEMKRDRLIKKLDEINYKIKNNE